jgi:hypothetical protein
MVIVKLMVVMRQRAQYIDKCVEVTKSILHPIPSYKLNQSEQKLINRVHEAKKKKMHWVQK